MCGSARTNDCDGQTLQFTCTCSNGSDANAALYINTIPFFVAQANRAQCIQEHPNDQQGQTQCTNDNRWGTLNASDTSTSSSSSSALPSSTAVPSSTSATSVASTPASATAATSSPASAAIREIAQDYSTTMVMAVLFAVFRLAL